MDAFWATFVGDLAARVTTGPMKFRLVLQPAMATFLAWRAGVADAKAGNPPYFWGLLSDSTDRRAMLKNGWKSISRVFILAVVLDIVYSLIVEKFVYPGQTLVVAFVLAIVPYVIVRGLVTRVMRSKYLHSGHGDFGHHHSFTRG